MGQIGLTVCILVALLPLTATQFIVEVLDRPRMGVRRTVQKCDATGANFGADIVSFSFGKESIGSAARTTPSNACKEISKVDNSTEWPIHFAIVPRGDCGFSEKAYYAQNAPHGGFRALIVYNNEGQPPIDMAGGKFSDQVIIPVVMVSYNCMKAIMETYPPYEGYLVQIKISPGYYDLFRYLIPFVVVVGFCFTVLVISLLIRLCRERRRIARKRLSKRNLKKIPTRRFKTGEEPETCAICLDDFIEGEKLRVLPCRHVYHCKCIDPWLTRNRKVCPMCKRRVGEKGSDSEDSDTGRTARVLVDQNRYRQLQEEDPSSGSMIVAYSPTERAGYLPVSSASSSQVHVDVHHDELDEMTGSRQLLVQDLEAAVQNDGEDVVPNESSSSASLRDRLRGFIHRVRRSPNGTEQTEVDDGAVTRGLDNVAFDEAAVAAASTPARVDASTSAGDESTRELISSQFADPFEDHTANAANGHH